MRIFFKVRESGRKEMVMRVLTADLVWILMNALCWKWQIMQEHTDRKEEWQDEFPLSLL
jgi:hypothetical protein